MGKDSESFARKATKNEAKRQGMYLSAKEMRQIQKSFTAISNERKKSNSLARESSRQLKYTLNTKSSSGTVSTIKDADPGLFGTARALRDASRSATVGVDRAVTAVEQTADKINSVASTLNDILAEPTPENIRTAAGVLPTLLKTLDEAAGAIRSAAQTCSGTAAGAAECIQSSVTGLAAGLGSLMSGVCGVAKDVIVMFIVGYLVHSLTTGWSTASRIAIMAGVGGLMIGGDVCGIVCRLFESIWNWIRSYRQEDEEEDSEEEILEASSEPVPAPRSKYVHNAAEMPSTRALLAAVGSLVALFGGLFFVTDERSSSFTKTIVSFGRTITAATVIAALGMKIYGWITTDNAEIHDLISKAPLADAMNTWLAEACHMMTSGSAIRASISRQYAKKVQKHAEEGDDLEIRVQRLCDVPEFRSLYMTWKRVRDLFNVSIDAMNKVLTPTTLRVEPTCIYLCGPPGVGKTTMIPTLLTDLLNDLEPGISHDGADELYRKNFQDDFWSGYHGQEGVLFDDSLQVKQNESNADFARELINCVNSATYNVNMPNLEAKGITKFVSRFLFITSNREINGNDMGDLRALVASWEAVTRRIHFEVHVRPRKEFNVGGRFDITKALADSSKKGLRALDPSVLEFQIRRKNGKEATRRAWKEGGPPDPIDWTKEEWISYEELKEALYEHSSEQQSRFLKQRATIDRTLVNEEISFFNFVIPGSSEEEQVVEVPYHPKEYIMRRAWRDGNIDLKHFEAARIFRQSQIPCDDQPMIDPKTCGDNIFEQLRSAAFVGNPITYLKKVIDNVQQALAGHPITGHVWEAFRTGIAFSRKTATELHRSMKLHFAVKKATITCSISKMKSQSPTVSRLFEFFKKYGKMLASLATLITAVAAGVATGVWQNRKREKWREAFKESLTLRGQCPDCKRTFTEDCSEHSYTFFGEDTLKECCLEHAKQVLNRNGCRAFSVDKNMLYYILVAVPNAEHDPSGGAVDDHMRQQSARLRRNGHQQLRGNRRVYSHNSGFFFPLETLNQIIRETPTKEDEFKPLSPDLLPPHDEVLRMLGPIHLPLTSLSKSVCVIEMFSRRSDFHMCRLTRGLFIGGRNLVTNHHFFRAFGEERPRVRITTKNISFETDLSDAHFFRRPESDVVIVQLGPSASRLPMAADLTKTIITQDELDKISPLGQTFFTISKEDTSAGSMNIIYPMQGVKYDVIAYDDDELHYTDLNIRCNGFSAVGLCGSPVVWADAHGDVKIVGIINASLNTSRKLMPTSVIFIPIPSIHETMKDENLTTLSELVKEGAKRTPRLYAENMLAERIDRGEEYFKKTGIDFVTIPIENTVRLSTKTALLPTPFYGLFPTTKEPAQLGPTANHPSPLAEMVTKNLKPSLDMPIHGLVDEVWEHVEAFSLLNREDRRPYTIDEVLHGVTRSGLPLEAVDLDTSPGWPYTTYAVKKTLPGKPGKRDFIVSDATGKRTWTDLGSDELARTCLMLANDEKFLFVDTLKDELRVSHKIYAPRVFNVGNFIINILLKVFYGPFQTNMMKSFMRAGEYAFGVNPYNEEEWTKIADRVFKSPVDFEDSLVINGDFSKFDKRIPTNILNACFDIMFEWTFRRYPKYREELTVIGGVAMTNELWMNKLRSVITHRRHLCGTITYDLDWGNPSGNALTTTINCLANSLIMRSALREICPEVPFTLTIYGDDNCLSLDATMTGLIDSMTLSNKLAEYDITYTGMEKDGCFREAYTAHEDVTFLKRRFVPSPIRQVYTAPLDYTTIINMIQWQRKTPDSHTALTALVHSVQRELSFYPIDLYDDTMHAIKRRAVEEGVILEFLSEDALTELRDESSVHYCAGLFKQPERD